MSDPLSGQPPRSYETNARFDGREWVAEVDGVPLRAARQGQLQQLVRGEVVRQTGNEQVLVVVNFL